MDVKPRAVCFARRETCLDRHKRGAVSGDDEGVLKFGGSGSRGRWMMEWMISMGGCLVENATGSLGLGC